MAVTGNAGEVKVQKEFKTIYGIAPFKVVAINPSMDQLISLGINAQKEPEYIKDDKARIEIWMESQLPKTKVEGVDKSLEELGIEKQLVHKLTVFVSDKNKGKSDGSTTTWINSFGSICSTPAGSNPSASWWKSQGEHIAREGEIELIKFIRAWVNAGGGDEVSIDNWDLLVKGNIKELKDILTTFKDNIVRSMISVTTSKDGKTYSAIDQQHHEPWNIVGLTNWAKSFNGNPPKAGKYISFTLKEFVATEPTPTADAAPTSEASSEWA